MNELERLLREKDAVIKRQRVALKEKGVTALIERVAHFQKRCGDAEQRCQAIETELYWLKDRHKKSVAVFLEGVKTAEAAIKKASAAIKKASIYRTPCFAYECNKPAVDGGRYCEDHRRDDRF